MRRLLAVAIAAVTILMAVGCGSGPARRAPVRPAVATVVIPCRPGSMGATVRCSERLTAPRFGFSRSPTGVPGIDLSNNDPTFGAGAWQAIRRHETFVYFKVSEGTGFIDPTAAQMAREARAAGLLVGGYDFQHVCGSSPVAEALVFVHAAAAAHLLSGPGVLPPTADFERSFGSCDRSVWLRAWSRTVRRIVPDQVYSDPGFYAPSVGCFSDADHGWVADLGGFQPLCGLRTDMHQWSFAAWDGVATVDGDVFLGTATQLRAIAHTTPPCVGACARAKHRRELRGHETVLTHLELQRTHLRAKLRGKGCSSRRHHHRRLGPKCAGWFAAGDRVAAHITFEQQTIRRLR